jgi:hypothetical protein
MRPAHLVALGAVLACALGLVAHLVRSRRPPLPDPPELGTQAGVLEGLRYDFGAGKAHTVKRYMVVSADVANRDPKTWTLQGSNDGSTWKTLDTQSNQTFANRSHANSYNIGNTTAYRFYQIDVTANNGAGSLAIAELGLLAN